MSSISERKVTLLRAPFLICSILIIDVSIVVLHVFSHMHKRVHVSNTQPSVGEWLYTECERIDMYGFLTAKWPILILQEVTEQHMSI